MPTAPNVTTLDAPRPVLCFEAIGAEAQIDGEKGILRGVSVMSKGPALGHSLEVDDTTLDQIVRQGNQRDRVPVYLQHGSGLGEHVGDAVNFRRDGDKARADIELYDSHPKRAFVLEKAHKNPTSFGISSESYPPPDSSLHVPKTAGGKVRFIRSTKLDALAFVRDPATNTSLFSQNQPEPDPNEMTADEFKTLFAEGIKPVMTELGAVKTDLGAVKTENAALKTQLAALPTEDQRKTELEAAATSATTKFAASCGIKPGQVPTNLGDASRSGGSEPSKTEFEVKMEEEKALGSANPQVSARFKHPELFNRHMALQTGKTKPGAY